MANLFTKSCSCLMFFLKKNEDILATFLLLSPAIIFFKNVKV